MSTTCIKNCRAQNKRRVNKLLININLAQQNIFHNQKIVDLQKKDLKALQEHKLCIICESDSYCISNEYIQTVKKINKIKKFRI